jgi:hypothetical protein
MKIKELFDQSVFASASVHSVREGAIAARPTPLMISSSSAPGGKIILDQSCWALLEGDDHAGLRYAAAPSDSCTPAAGAYGAARGRLHRVRILAISAAA